MKANHSSDNSLPTGIRCRLARLGTVVLKPSSSVHISTCPSCQRYFASTDQLDSALRQQATVSGIEPSGDFERELISAIRSAPLPPRRPTRARSWAFSGLAASAAAAAAVFTLLLRPQHGTDNSLSPAEGAAVIASTVESLSNGLVERVIPSAGELVTGNPLQQDVALVYSDMRSALDFLALNFLPTTTAPEPQSGHQI